MSKKGRMLVVMIAVMIQVVLGALYGFSGVSVPAWCCFGVWCACAAVFYRFVGEPEIV